MLIKRRIIYDSDETEIKIIFTDLSQHFRIYLVGIFHSSGFYSLAWGKR